MEVENPDAGGEKPEIGTVLAVGVFDASSGGNLLAYSTLTTNKTIDTGDVFRINAGDLDIRLA